MLTGRTEVSRFRTTGHWMMLGLLGIVLTASAQNTLSLNVSQATHVIKKELYGGLLEQLGRQIYGSGALYAGSDALVPNTNGVRNDVIAAFKEAGIGCLQWPGGCYAEEYHWANGVGPVAGRSGTNEFGTDEFIQFCKLVGCEPYLTGNMKTGTATENANWIAYCLAKPDWNLKYWGMGNEPWGGCGYTMNVTNYMNLWDKYNDSISAANKAKLVRIASSGTWLTGNTPILDSVWMDAIMKRETGKMEGISWHSYTCISWSSKGSSTTFTDADWYSIIYRAYEVESFIRRTIPIMDKYDPNVTVGLMVDEWGNWFNALGGMGTFYQQNTLRDALSAAIHLNTFNNCAKRVKMGLIAQPLNVIQSLVLTNTGANRAQMVKTPTFYVYKMYKVHQNAKTIPATLQSATTTQNGFTFPLLTSSASVDSSGKVNITVGNVGITASQTLQIQLTSSKTYGSVSGQIITASAITALNNFGAAEQVNIQPFANSNFSLSGTTLTATIPAKSVVLLTLAPAAVGINGTLQRQPVRDLKFMPSEGRGIVISGSVTRPTPVTFSFYGINGRTLAGTFSTALDPGRSNLLWQPDKQGGLGTGVYMVRIKADGITQTQKTAFTR